MDSPMNVHSQRNAALAAALTSPSGEMNQVLTQLMGSMSAPSSTPSSPISPIIVIPPVTPPHAVQEETHMSGTFKSPNTLDPTTVLTQNETNKEATPDVKPAIHLDLSSPLFLTQDSPILKQKWSSKPTTMECSVSSILDQEPLSPCRQPELETPDTQQTPGNQQTPDTQQTIQGSPLVLQSARQSLTTLDPQPMLDLSRPITLQRYQQSGPCSSQMEIPMVGDFTLLGMEFQSVPNVGTPQTILTSSAQWKDADFKFDSKIGNLQNFSLSSQHDNFSCSQLEIPFSQLENIAEIKDVKSNTKISHRSPNPSQGALGMRAYRAKKSIIKSVDRRLKRMSRITVMLEYCKGEMKKCTSKSMYNQISDTRMMVRDALKKANEQMASIKSENRTDDERMAEDCKAGSTDHRQISSTLESELSQLTEVYMSYRNVVILLRDLYNSSWTKKCRSTLPMVEHSKRTTKQEHITVEQDRQIKQIVELKPSIKREPECVVPGVERNKRHCFAPQKYSPTTATVKPAQYRQTLASRARATDNGKEKLKTELIVKDFFKKQLDLISEGRNVLACSLKQRSCPIIPLPTRVRRLRGEDTYFSSCPGSPGSPADVLSPTPTRVGSLSPSTPVFMRHPSSAFSSTSSSPASLSRSTSQGVQTVASCSMTYLSPSVEVRAPDKRDMSTCTPSRVLPRPGQSPVFFSTPLLKEVKIKNSKYKTPEQIQSRVRAHKALADLQNIFQKDRSAKEEGTLCETLLDYNDVLETLQSSSATQQSSVPRPRTDFSPNTLGLLSEDSCENVVRLMISENRIETGYNTIFTLLNEERMYGSIDENGYVLYMGTVYKSCAGWLKAVHSSSDIDTLNMAYSSNTERALGSELQEYLKSTSNLKSTQLQRTECTNSDFEFGRDGLEFFDIISLLENDCELSAVTIEEYIPISELELPPHFWVVQSAQLPASITEDIDDWPDH